MQEDRRPETSLRVLVVDDDPVLGKLFLEVLVAHGHQGTVVETGSAALDAVQREVFDLVISDLRMPEMGGRELLQRLQQEHPRLAETMVFASAEEPRAAACRFVHEGGHRYLKKPFSLAELMRVIEAVVTRPSGG
jgi:CheY-like chemotaxis protein